MDDNYVSFGRSTQFSAVQTNDDHFRRQVYIGITFIERDVFLNVKEEDIINCFMTIRRRRPDMK
jgi:hypothetical protein